MILSHERVASIKRFAKYTLISSTAFGFDLLLLFILVDVFSQNQVIAAGIAFVIATSIQYFIVRRIVFPETQQTIARTYVAFLTIGTTGLLVIMGLMYIMTTILEWNYLVSRIGIAGFVGMWNYLMNLYINFKVAGIHKPDTK